MTSYKLNETMLCDLKRYFKYRKREMYNTFLNGYKASPFPLGKQRTGVYDKHLKEIFWTFEEFTYIDILGDKIPNERCAIVTTSRGTKVVCHPEVGFKYYMIRLQMKHSYSLEKISKCYDMYEKCVATVKASGHDDLSVYCNKIYARLLKAIFRRFHVNPKCIEYKPIKGMELILHLPKEQEK